jgi:hypothetical protein
MGIADCCIERFFLWFIALLMPLPMPEAEIMSFLLEVAEEGRVYTKAD